MTQKRTQEREVTFAPRGGHNHDGENSSPIKLLNGSVTKESLNNSLVAWIRSLTDLSDRQAPMMVPDLEIKTPPIAPGASYTGSETWAGICVVRFVRVQMSQDTGATLTFYHTGSFDDQDREFRAREVSNHFMWEGAWVHYDETFAKKIWYKIENTGNTSASFILTLKSGTMVANELAKFIEMIKTDGKELTGPVTLVAGPGINITADEDTNIITISAG